MTASKGWSSWTQKASYIEILRFFNWIMSQYLNLIIIENISEHPTMKKQVSLLNVLLDETKV